MKTSEKIILFGVGAAEAAAVAAIVCSRKASAGGPSSGGLSGRFSVTGTPVSNRLFAARSKTMAPKRMDVPMSITVGGSDFSSVTVSFIGSVSGGNAAFSGNVQLMLYSSGTKLRSSPPSSAIQAISIGPGGSQAVNISMTAFASDPAGALGGQVQLLDSSGAVIDGAFGGIGTINVEPPSLSGGFST